MSGTWYLLWAYIISVALLWGYAATLWLGWRRVGRRSGTTDITSRKEHYS
jgi:hypothetical protein